MMRQLKISKSITVRESPSFEKYLQEIGKIPLLKTEEEVQLARKIRMGDDRALEKLTKANLRFVVSVAKQYQNQGLPLSELVNEGNVGLIKAAQRFDETRGFKFISYAVWWIRQSILAELAENARIVRVPTNTLGLSNMITKVHDEFMQEFEREPSTEELAEILDLETDVVNLTASVTCRHESLDAEIPGSENVTMLETMEDTSERPPDFFLERTESLSREIRCLLKTFTEQQRTVIILCYGIGLDHALSMEDIGKKMGFGHERARQINRAVLEILRNNPRYRNILKKYLA